MTKKKQNIKLVDFLSLYVTVKIKLSFANQFKLVTFIRFSYLFTILMLGIVNVDLYNYVHWHCEQN